MGNQSKVLSPASSDKEKTFSVEKCRSKSFVLKIQVLVKSRASAEAFFKGILCEILQKNDVGLPYMRWEIKKEEGTTACKVI